MPHAIVEHTQKPVPDTATYSSAMEWIQSAAVSYARRFAGMLRAKGVFVSVEDQEDLASAFRTGAFEAYKTGIRDLSLLEKHGREQTYACRESIRNWGTGKIPLTEELDQYRPMATDLRVSSVNDPRGTVAHSLTVHPNAELHELMQAAILIDVLEEYPDGLEKEILHVQSYGIQVDGQRTVLDHADLAEHLNLPLEEFTETSKRANDKLIAMMRSRIHDAPSHPDAVLPV